MGAHVTAIRVAPKIIMIRRTRAGPFCVFGHRRSLKKIRSAAHLSQVDARVAPTYGFCRWVQRAYSGPAITKALPRISREHGTGQGAAMDKRSLLGREKNREDQCRKRHAG